MAWPKGKPTWNAGMRGVYKTGADQRCREKCICGRHDNGGNAAPCVDGCECGRHRGTWLGRSFPASLKRNQKISVTMKRKAAAGELFSEEHRHNLSLGVAEARRRKRISPNKLEQRVADLTGFQFVGDGTLIIDGKSPDFWNGGNKLLEVFGDYWHREDDFQKRIDHFARHGYECLVIWEHEVKEDSAAVVAIVAEFCGVHHGG